MSVRIGLGMAAFPFSSTRAFWRWVELCEDGDVDSLWQSDRLLASDASPRPQLETMSLMAALAGATERLKFGMNVVVLPLRDPIALAAECATIDFLSDGRLLPAFGVGGNASPAWAATGRDPRGRGARSNEALEIMTALWRGERVTFEGEHYRVADASIAPAPVQQPMPLWIGGSSRAAIRRTVRYGNGWLGGLQTPAQVAPVVASIREEAARQGTRIPDDHYGANITYRFGSWDEPEVERATAAFGRLAVQDRPDPRDHVAVGDASDIIRRVEEYVAVGVTKFVVRPIAESDDELMEQTRRLIDEVLPVVHGDGGDGE
ncbi:MAG: TIGR03619 family F420-dependent LLM class oxidoreductase [Chloroflexi bacterium]|nr:TIGR03619 family F420-dependent LLM class oxidoreductase [Chloroflexota bacterium]